MKTRKIVSTIAMVSLAAVMMVGGVYAYFSQTSTIDNPFDTGSYGSTAVENFKPSDGTDWQPGVEIKKEVFASNTGDTDLIVRARLDETWARSNTPTVFYKDSASTVPGKAYDVYEVDQKVKDDGLTDADKSVVYKNFSTSTKWYKHTDGWYYYVENLPGGQKTDMWLSSVELKDDADMGKMETKTYVSWKDVVDEKSTAFGDWFLYTTPEMPLFINKTTGAACLATSTNAAPVLHNKKETTYAKDGSNNPLLGYSKSDYTLKVTIQTVQPTQEALDAVFGENSSFAHPGGVTWTLK